MNDRLQENLARARADLLVAQSYLRHVRALKGNFGLAYAEYMFCKTLDRAWDAQCMANPGLQ